MVPIYWEMWVGTRILRAHGLEYARACKNIEHANCNTGSGRSCITESWQLIADMRASVLYFCFEGFALLYRCGIGGSTAVTGGMV